MSDRKKPIGRLDVDVSACARKRSSLTCDMCHATSPLIEVKIPVTKFFDGRKLSTRYNKLRMCESCHDKLVSAICIPFKKEGNHD